MQTHDERRAVATGHTSRRQQPRPPEAPEVPVLADEYLTESLNVVAYLMCLGNPVLRYKRGERRTTFAFAGLQACTDLAQSFSMGIGEVNALAYARNLDWARMTLHLGR